MTKTKKSLSNKKTFKTHLDFLIKEKMDFTLKLSNYTSEINCQAMPYFNIRHFASEMPKITYLAHSRIKKDLLNWSANDIPQIDKYNCVYYDLAQNPEKVKSDYATNFDLTSAYATLLYTNCFIQKSTFEFLAKLPKRVRLIAVGMLASNKDIFSYQDGVPIFHDKITNPLENYFYWCLDKTAEVMRNLKAKLETDFIFTWVDSIYYLPHAANDLIIENEIKLSGLSGKFTPLENLKIVKNDEIIRIDFYDTIKNKPKYFNIPLNSSFKKDILYAYGLH